MTAEEALQKWKVGALAVEHLGKVHITDNARPLDRVLRPFSKSVVIEESEQRVGEFTHVLRLTTPAIEADAEKHIAAVPEKKHVVVVA